MATEETISNLVLRHAWIGITLFKIVKNNLYSLMKIIHKVPFAVSICNRILKYRVWKIEFDELDFLSISNSNFAGYTGSKNLVQIRQKFQFIKLDPSNSIFQSLSADKYCTRPLDQWKCQAAYSARDETKWLDFKVPFNVLLSRFYPDFFRDSLYPVFILKENEHEKSWNQNTTSEMISSQMF